MRRTENRDMALPLLAAADVGRPGVALAAPPALLAAGGFLALAELLLDRLVEGAPVEGHVAPSFQSSEFTRPPTFHSPSRCPPATGPTAAMDLLRTGRGGGVLGDGFSLPS